MHSLINLLWFGCWQQRLLDMSKCTPKPLDRTQYNVIGPFKWIYGVLNIHQDGLRVSNYTAVFLFLRWQQQGHELTNFWRKRWGCLNKQFLYIWVKEIVFLLQIRSENETCKEKFTAILQNTCYMSVCIKAIDIHIPLEPATCSYLIFRNWFQTNII